jgi:nuclear pore complex protein Nup98-Nup96
MFGSAANAGGGGTRAAPYQVTSRQDGTSSITLHAITAMQQYESKSFEELRFEDYSQGNKGSSTGQAPGGFGATSNSFASPAPSNSTFGGGFGSTPAAAPAAGVFGGKNIKFEQMHEKSII